MKIELICDPGCHLGECPVWCGNDKKLYFTDINECRLYRCSPQKGEFEIFWQGDRKVGGFAFNQRDEVIMFAENKVLNLNKDGNIETLFTMEFALNEQFNDITTDPAGRIFAGTMVVGGGNGQLFCFESEKAPKLVLENIECSNGMTFSLDEKSFYHTNTGAYTITKYKYDKLNGAISDGKVFFQGDKTMGLPDGLTIDNEGCIWSAFWDDAVIRRFSPKGDIIKEVRLPAKRPTSVIFGGDDLKELFITTASVGRVSPENRVNENGEFLGGGIYRIVPGVHGREEYKTTLGV